MTTRDRRLARADRLEEWSEGRRAKADELHARNEPYRGDIAFNTQPGHIPERARAIRRTEKAWEHERTAADMAERAVGIRAQAKRAIYDDDPDALDRLREKLAGLEAKRENAKQRNAAYRKEHRAELAKMTTYERGQAMPFPSYYGQNLSGQITTTRKRIATLEARAARTGTTAKPPYRLALKYGGPCRDCGRTLDAGTTHYYDRSERELICTDCHEGTTEGETR